MKPLLIAVLFAAGCHHHSDPAPKHEEHENLSPELAKFHDVLAPRWHAEQGAKRMSDTCGAIGEFQADADAIAKATPAATTDAAKWSAGAKELSDAVTALDATCKANDATAFEPAFARVHTGFHGMMEAGEH